MTLEDVQNSQPIPARASSTRRPDHLIWRVFKNTTVQIAGRMFVTVAKLAMAALIVRASGSARFGEFSVILTLLMVVDMVADFGWHEISVRELSQRPGAKTAVLANLTLAKVLLTIAAYAALAGLLGFGGYEPSTVRAGLIAGLEVFFYGGILVYRALFKATLTMEREVVAEIASTCALLGFLWIACVHGARLEVLGGCWALSRIVFFVVVFALGRREFPLTVKGVRVRALYDGFRAALPIGMGGFVVAVGHSLGMLMLDKLDTDRAVGLYAGALRFMYPIMFVSEALASSLYPVLAGYWARDKDQFRRFLQLAVDLLLVLAGMAFCGYQASAEFLMGLLGTDLIEGARALRGLTYVFFSMGIGTLLFLVIVIVEAQRWIFWFASAAVIVMTALLALLIPPYGFMGAVYAWVLVELFLGALPALLLVQHYTRTRLHWWALLRVAAASVLCLLPLKWLGLFGTFWGGALATTLYLPAAIATGAIRRGQIRMLHTALRARFSKRNPARGEGI